jgi:hypothetical protein
MERMSRKRFSTISLALKSGFLLLVVQAIVVFDEDHHFRDICEPKCKKTVELEVILNGSKSLGDSVPSHAHCFGSSFHHNISYGYKIRNFAQDVRDPFRFDDVLVAQLDGAVFFFRPVCSAIQLSFASSGVLLALEYY